MYQLINDSTSIKRIADGTILSSTAGGVAVSVSATVEASAEL